MSCNRHIKSDDVFLMKSITKRRAHHEAGGYRQGRE